MVAGGRHGDLCTQPKEKTIVQALRVHPQVNATGIYEGHHVAISFDSCVFLEPSVDEVLGYYWLCDSMWIIVVCTKRRELDYTRSFDMLESGQDYFPVFSVEHRSIISTALLRWIVLESHRVEFDEEDISSPI